MNIAICDDNQKELEHLCSLVREYQRRHPSLEIQAERFPSMQALAAQMENGSEYQLFLLDILMPGCTGIEFAQSVRQGGGQGAFIFVSASREYALDAFSVDAMQYILKPVEGPPLFAAMDKAMRALRTETAKSMAVSTQEGIKTIHYHNIVFVECAGHFVHFHLTDGTNLCSKTLRQSFASYVAPLLADERFVRTHHSFVVNKQHVLKLSQREFLLSGDYLVPISRDKFADVKASYLNFVDRRTEL